MSDEKYKKPLGAGDMSFIPDLVLVDAVKELRYQNEQLQSQLKSAEEVIRFYATTGISEICTDNGDYANYYFLAKGENLHAVSNETMAWQKKKAIEFLAGRRKEK